MADTLRDELHELYTMQGLSGVAVAALYGKPPKWVYYWLHKLDIPTRAKGRPKGPPKATEEELRRLRFIDAMSLQAIADKFGVTRQAVSLWFKRLGVPVGKHCLTASL